jgi:hypothetical protein
LEACPAETSSPASRRSRATYGSGGEISHTRLTVGQGKLCLIRSRDDGATWDPTSQQPVFDLADDRRAHPATTAANRTRARRRSTSSTRTSS